MGGHAPLPPPTAFGSSCAQRHRPRPRGSGCQHLPTNCEGDPGHTDLPSSAGGGCILTSPWLLLKPPRRPCVSSMAAQLQTPSLQPGSLLSCRARDQGSQGAWPQPWATGTCLEVWPKIPCSACIRSRAGQAWRTGPAFFLTKVPGASVVNQPPCQTLCVHTAVVGFIDKEVEVQKGECQALGHTE